MDSYITCHYCHKHLTNPLELVCRHSYCADCLTKELHNNKIECPICGTEHAAPGASLSSAKPDILAPYLIGLNSGAPYSSITDSSPASMQAECSGCKKLTDLRICFHCEKPLCTDCRNKHYDAQKKNVDHSINHLATKTDELVGVAKALNISRNNRIQEYKLMKDKVSTHMTDLTKKMHDEEQDLQKKIDARIQFETEKIAITERELEHLRLNKSALDGVEDTYRKENNQMVLLKMHKEYLTTATSWKGKLDTQASRLDPKKEEELHLHLNNTGQKDVIVGTLTNAKNVNIYAKRGDQTSSRTCTIL